MADFGCGAIMTSAGVTASAAPAVCAGVGYYAGELTADTLELMRPNHWDRGVATRLPGPA